MNVCSHLDSVCGVKQYLPFVIKDDVNITNSLLIILFIVHSNLWFDENFTSKLELRLESLSQPNFLFSFEVGDFVLHNFGITA